MTKTELVEWCRTNRRDGALFGFGLSADGDDLHLVESDKSGFNYREGVPAMYMARTGKKVVRADINGMGRMVSQAGFFNASGGYYTFDPAIAEAIGGYPYGAILRWKDPDSGLVRIVRSLKPDNKDDFVADPSLIDGDSWDFADRALPMSVRPRVFPRWDLAAPAFPTGKPHIWASRTSSLHMSQGCFSFRREQRTLKASLRANQRWLYGRKSERRGTRTTTRRGCSPTSRRLPTPTQ